MHLRAAARSTLRLGCSGNVLSHLARKADSGAARSALQVWPAVTVKLRMHLFHRVCLYVRVLQVSNVVFVLVVHATASQ